jgi:crotonobetainyl-CoA:carnitine CoA-transferase CaiB-like acyl-CoA transferase
MDAALHERQRTGRGVHLDLSLAEAAMSFTAIRHGLDLDRVTRDHLWPTNDLFETANGEWIALGIVEEHFWRNFVAAARDLAPDLGESRYASEPERRRAGDALAARMCETMRQRTTEDWLERFRRHDVPAQRVLTPAEASRSAQTTIREMVLERDGERHIPFPVRVDGGRGATLRNTAPAIGADTEAVLAELGFAPGEQASLASSGVLGPREPAQQS